VITPSTGATKVAADPAATLWTMVQPQENAPRSPAASCRASGSAASAPPGNPTVTTTATAKAAIAFSQTQHQIADSGRLRQEGMVAGIELDDTARPPGELALSLSGGAAVLSADEVRRGQLLPGCRLHRLPEDRQALPCRPVQSLLLDLWIAVLEERLD
jgi:hypothetical protein